MRKKKFIPLALLCMLIVGCAGLSKMTPQERGRTFCDDLMTQHESLQAQSLEILASDSATVETKTMVATVVNPKLNKLKPLILDYCETALAGGAPSTAQITTMIADVSALLAKAPAKKGGK